MRGVKLRKTCCSETGLGESKSLLNRQAAIEAFAVAFHDKVSSTS